MSTYIIYLSPLLHALPHPISPVRVDAQKQMEHERDIKRREERRGREEGEEKVSSC
jgi:hypothetical protein